MGQFIREIHAKLPQDVFEEVSKIRKEIGVTWDEYQVIAAIVLRNINPEVIKEAKRRMYNGEWDK